MRSIEIKVYQYKELSPEAQEHAVTENYDYDLGMDYETEYHEERLADIGFTNADINFSGFSSQGDGASFTADVDLDRLFSYIVYNSTSWEEVKRFNNLMVLRDKELIDLTFWSERTSSHYSHENTCTIRHEIDLYQEHMTSGMEDHLLDVAEDMAQEIEDIRHELSQEIYSSLEKDYEYRQSAKYLSELWEANDIEFTSEGNIY